nr:hypothetical protein [Tanacetum cinerariifolium]
MHVYVELVKKDEEHDSDSDSESVNKITDEENVVDEVEDKAFRAKAKAQVHLRGDVKVQYALLRDYVCELKRCNPDTTLKIDLYGEEDLETPTRMFRRIYTWFLKFVGDDFDLYSNSNFTFITDMQKGLLPALKKLFPSAEHR